MSEALICHFKKELSAELSDALADIISDLEHGRFREILKHRLVRDLVGHDASGAEPQSALAGSPPFDWNDQIFDRLGEILSKRVSSGEEKESSSYLQHFFFLVALAALFSFVQATVTGPPLPFDSASTLFSDHVLSRGGGIQKLQSSLIQSLTVDGEAAYRLVPHVELLCLADSILTSPPIKKNIKLATWAKLRTDFIHQRLLSAPSSTLQRLIYDALETVEDDLNASELTTHRIDILSQFILERATVHTFHELDKKSSEDLERAAKLRNFEFALTGHLGKRTKWQSKETSQLIVLARSAQSGSGVEHQSSRGADTHSMPTSLNLDDDTLLEKISFTKTSRSSMTGLVDQAALSTTLADLEPGNQPLLHPLDSILLLSLAASITNTSPADGLTREGTLPYAERVLEGGSSNWQVYTQALLVRSRIEGYKARTTERGLLQLQALVDQIIADTTPENAPSLVVTDTSANSTFLPRPKASESASASERLLYIFQLCTPTRWELEAELAARWVSLGGLRSALDIYERLEMWPEAALCLAAVGREIEATRMIRKLLFHSTTAENDAEAPEDERWLGRERDPAPTDAPRLYCILGDFLEITDMYEKAWAVSNERYARAQRSLGLHYFKERDYVQAAASYSKALKVNALNQSSWFALGCALLELSEFEKAAEAFARTVQLDDSDAEAWSNLAAALLRKGPPATPTEKSVITVKLDDEEDDENGGRGAEYSIDPQKHKKDALNAFKRAARLQHSNFRLWENVMTVAISLNPPAWLDVVAAQDQIIDLKASTEGEKCVDVQVLELLIRHVVSTSQPPSVKQETNGRSGDLIVQGSNYGLPRLVTEMLDSKVQPLITSSARLWRLIATLEIWRKDFDSALAAHEKAWRVATAASNGWETGTEEQWNDVVESTVNLADAYESLSPDKWQIKARNAVKGILGRGKQSWEGTRSWETLMTLRESLSAKKS